ncbi:MAG: hypothetical protein JSU92_09755 [Deltaproteobacteria bacterium]|nr:MAG: hypothetical protein JSU92_09755 [Deltaproteobacteria bacterium]
MTIKEHLTPDFLAWLIILVTILINLTIFSIVSNYTVDGKIPKRFQSGVFVTAIFMTLSYAVLVILHLLGHLPNYPTLYPNSYDFLLMGKGKALACIGLGVVMGLILGAWKGNNNKLRIGTGIGAVICESAVVTFAILWVLNQT